MIIMSAELNSVGIGLGSLEQPTEFELYEFPWKYIGYKDLAAYVASDPDFFALRRFDRLHMRSLLTLQDQLCELEQKLDAMDSHFSQRSVKLKGSKPPRVIDTSQFSNELAGESLRDINNGTIRDDMADRAALVEEITAKLKEYDEAMKRYAWMRRLSPAPERNIKNLETWFDNNEGAIMEAEKEFIEHRDELISMSSPKSMARKWFEDQILLRADMGLRFLRKKRGQYSALGSRDEKSTHVFSDQAMDTLESLAVFLAALVMLVGPLWILERLDTLQRKLIVITVFVFLCLGFLSLATLGRPFEKLAATAGYSAVLVVFLQLGSKPSD
ncbi:hypothetical protein F4777DRAFT_495460 [Nemania sp. FL0916]|nr:hypothetical protein F4777DRAFT_495460 [Nemania sp. FL0916]